MRIPLWSRGAASERDFEYVRQQRRENTLERKVLRRNATEDSASGDTNPPSSTISDQFTSSVPPIETSLSQTPSSVAPIVDPVSSVQASISTSPAPIAEPSTAEVLPVVSSVPSPTSSAPPLDTAPSQVPSLTTTPPSVIQSTAASDAEATSAATSAAPAVVASSDPAASQIANSVAPVPSPANAGAPTDSPSVQTQAPVASAVATTAADTPPALSPTEAAGSGASGAASSLNLASAAPVSSPSSGSGSQTIISGDSSAFIAGSPFTADSATAHPTGATAASKATASADPQESASAAGSEVSENAHATPLKLSKPSATLLDSLSIPASTTFATSITAIPVFDSLPTATGAANSGNGNAKGQSGVNGGVDVDGNPNGSDGGSGITTVAKDGGGPKTSVIVSGVVIGVSVLAIIILLIFISRRIFRKHRLGKAESPPSSPGFQVPKSPYPDRLARSMNQISMQRELEMGTGTAEGNGFLKWNEDVKEFGLGRREMDEKWDHHSTSSYFKDNDVEGQRGLMGNLKGKMGSLTSMIKRG